ncbi:MAG TPA: polysaccharide biosynthesis tyrosine autokinase [Gaiellales bacterium]|nr:polysaccharide biosynthesis tyrosine autokinase [Gaiellales bacterium]
MAEQRLTTLSDYLGVLRRRIWIVILAIVIAVGAAYLVSSRQTPAYEATSEVNVGGSSISTILNPASHVSSSVVQQNVASAAQAAHTTRIAAATLKAAGVHGMTPQDLLDETTITPSSTTSFFTIAVTDRHPDRSMQLATAYANTYVVISNRDAVAGLNAKLQALNSKIAKLQKKINTEILASGGKQSAGASDQTVLTNLLKQQGAYQNGLASLSNNNQVAQRATQSTKVRPATTRNLVMGFGIGLVIGLVLVSLAEALDTRIRHSDDVAQRLGLPLLTRIPIPPRSLRKASSLGMLHDEGGIQTEAYRKLRINLDFANLSIKARTIMVTSATEQEGKSTTVANLAVALAKAGRRVVLVDLDLRKPYLDRFFDLTGRPGITDVALGHVTLDQAMWSIPIPGADGGSGSGSLHVLPSGPMPPNPADLIESSVVTEVLLDLAERADVVLLDSAPLLPVADGVVLSNKVDGMLVVVRAATIRRPILNELQRVLTACPAAKLGFVLTGSDEGEGYGYGYGYGGGGYAAPVPGRPEQAGNGQPANGAEGVPGQSTPTQPY